MRDKKYLILVSTFFLLITLLLGYIISHISIVIGIIIIMILPLAFFIMEIFVTSQESVFDKTFRKVGVMFLCVLVSSNIYFMIKDIGDFKWNNICDIVIYTSLISLLLINLILLIILKVKYDAKIDDVREEDFNYFYNKYYKIDERTERKIKRNTKKSKKNFMIILLVLESNIIYDLSKLICVVSIFDILKISTLSIKKSSYKCYFE